MSGVKETSELLRAVSAVLVEYLDAVKDEKFGALDKLKFIGLYSTISAGIKGVSDIGGELRELDDTEKKALLDEISDTLRRTGKFSAMEAGVAVRVLDLAYHNILEVSAMLSLPPSAIAA